jgi:hypothetical protein
MEKLIIDSKLHERLGFTILSKEDIEKRRCKNPLDTDNGFNPKGITLEEARIAMQKCKKGD